MYWSFSIHPSNEYSRLISFRKDWFDLLAVQGTLKSLQISFLIENFFFVFFWLRHVACGIFRSPTRDGTHASFVGRVEG